MGSPGVSAGSVGTRGGGGSGGGVTPGGGSSGFTPGRIIVANAAGALDDATDSSYPPGSYSMAPAAGDDFTLVVDMEPGGVGAVGGQFPSIPVALSQVGWDYAYSGGSGSDASAGAAAGAGGLGQVYGGFGGDGTALRAAGRGGDVYIASAPGGANGGGGGARGGDVFVDGSEGTGGQRNGDVVLGGVTVGVWGTRYVIVGGSGLTVPLVVAAGAPLSTERMSVAPDTDGPGAGSATAVIGRGRIGALSADEFTLAHVDRFSATSYGLSMRGSDGATFVNSVTDIILAIGGTSRWQIPSTGHFRPYADAAYDIGSSATNVRDYYMSRDFIGSAGAAHSWYVAAAAAGSGTSGGAATFRAGHGAAATAGVTAANGALGTFSGGNGGAGAAGRAPGSGGGAYLFGGDAGTRVDTGNPSGGGVEIRGGVGRVAGAGGSVEIYAGGSGTGGTAGHILLTVGDADGTYGYIRIGNSASERVGFYTTTGVAQAAHPTTLAEVITILTNLGLCA